MVILIRLQHLVVVLETLVVLLAILYFAALISLFFRLPPPSQW